MSLTLGGEAIDLHLHVEVIALCLGLLVAYAGLIRRYGALMHPRPDERAVSRGQVTAFTLGVVAIWVASGSPIHDLSERYLYSAHMIQHMVQAFVAAPLLVMGVPGWMAELLTRPAWLRAAVRFLGRPVVAGLLFNAVFAFIHWPAVVDAMVRVEVAHAGSHWLLVLAGLAMWLPVASPADTVAPRMSRPGAMFYLFLMTLLPTIPSGFLTFGETPLYHAYEAFPRLWGLSALDDMQIAGLIMKVGGGLLLWGIIAVLFFRWAADEERRDRADAAGGVDPRIVVPPSPDGADAR